MDIYVKLLCGIVFVGLSFLTALLFSARKWQNIMLFLFGLCLCLRINLFSIGGSTVDVVRYNTDYWNFLLIDFFAYHFGFVAILKAKWYNRCFDFGVMLPILYFLLTALSILQAINKMAAITTTARAAVLVLFYFYFSRVFNPDKQGRYFIQGLFIGVWFEGAIAYLQKISGDAIGLSFLGESSSAFRTHLVGMIDSTGVAGTFEHSADFAIYLIFALCIFIFSKSFFKTEISFYLTLLIILSSIYLTDSRTVLFLSFIPLTVYILKNMKLEVNGKLQITKEIKKILWCFSFLLPCVVLIAGKHLLAMTDSASLMISLNVRLSQWAEAIELILKSPWLGYGANNYVDIMHANYKEIYDTVWNLQNPVHNTFLLFWFDLGLGGFFLAITMQLYYALQLFNKRSDLSVQRGFGVFIMVSIFYWLTGWAFMKRPTIYMLWMAYGIISNHNVEVKSQNGK